VATFELADARKIQCRERPRKKAASGTPSDRLVRLFDDDHDAFDALACELLDAGREGVLSMA
jgi:hypothetical protein